MLESILALFIFLFEVPTGIFADKFSRKKSIIAGIAIFFIETVMMIFAEGFLMFAIIFALTGIGVTFMSGSVEALIYDVLKKQNRAHLMKNAMGNYGFSSLMGKFIAPVIGAYIARDLIPVQFTALVYLTLFAILIAFFLSLSLKDDGGKDTKSKNPSPARIFLEGVELMRSNKFLMRIILLDIFTSPFIFEFKYLSQQNFKNAGINVSTFGFVFGLALLLSALAKKYAYKFETLLGMKRAIFLITILPGTFFVSLAFISNSVWLVISFVLVRVFAEISGPLFSEYRNSHIPSVNRATVISLISMLGCFYLMFARLIIGKLANVNFCYAFVFMGTVIIVASLFFRLQEAHVRVPEPAYLEL
jgi:MFS family permease